MAANRAHEMESGNLHIQGPAFGTSGQCAPILRSLPEWFGIESATRYYIDVIDSLPTFTATVNGGMAGFLTLKHHFDQAAEIYVMGVAPYFHRQGCGRALLSAAEATLHEQGIRYLQVKTLSPTHPDSNYALTREFYKAVGFTPLEEFPTLWSETNPCLLLVKWLGR